MHDGRNHCQAEKMAALSRFTSAMSHKVSNSLTYVLNYTFILKSSIADEKSLSMLRKMEEGIIRAKEVLQQVTDISNPIIETLAEVDVKACLEEGMSEVIGNMAKKGVTVEIESSGPAKVMASWAGLIRAFTVLFENSVEAGATNIKVNTLDLEDAFEIRIEDNGSGIQEEHSDMIFEPFFTTKSSAAGLGLYILYHIVKSLGGLTKFGKSDMGGAVFHVILKKAPK